MHRHRNRLYSYRRENRAEGHRVLPCALVLALRVLRAPSDAMIPGQSLGVLSGFHVLTLRIEPGGGLN